MQIKNFQKYFYKKKFKQKAFFCLFSIFFSSLALAATLSVTWLYQYLPNNPDVLGLACYTSDGAYIESDGAQEPNDVAFSNDGLTYFIANESMKDPNGYDITVYKLETPFDIESLKEDCSQDRFDLGTLARGDGSGPLANGTLTSVWGKLYDMEFSASGDKIFIVNGVSFLMQFSLSKPFDLSTASFDVYQDLDPNYGSLTFNREGTKMFWLEHTGDATKVRTYETSSPFDISSLTLSHTLDLSSTELNTITGTQNAQDMHFNDTGSAAYILIYGGTDNRDLSAIYQFRLSKAYDMSTASLRGKWSATFENGATGIPTGFTFGDGGMKVYITEIESGTGVDRTNVYSLECPYGIYECTSDPVSNIGSQVQLAKQNINHNISTIFKRFEWIKRNRKNENLNNFNVKIISQNPLLETVVASLGNKFQESKYKRQISLKNSQTKNKKKSDWSYWSHGEISIGNYEATSVEKPKHIKTRGLTFGADKKYGKNKFAGLALRFAENGANIRQSAQNTDMKSLTLNIYGIIPQDENKYVNLLFGLSALKFDQKYLGHTTGNRNGQQAFVAANLRTKKTYGNLNLTPIGRFTYGITHLTDFTDIISSLKPATDTLYYDKTFRTGEVAGGFLFNLGDIKFFNGISNPHGSLELIWDITPDIDFEYSNHGSTARNISTIKKYSFANIKGNIGLEHVNSNGLTVSMNYERIQHIDDARYSHTDSFLIKLGRLNENDYEFALIFDPLINNKTNINYFKSINGYDFNFSSDYSLENDTPEYGIKLVVSNQF